MSSTDDIRIFSYPDDNEYEEGHEERPSEVQHNLVVIVVPHEGCVEREVDKEGGEQAGDRTAQDDVVIFFLET